jgi:hypothetical protein
LGERHASNHGTQPGDPFLTVKLMVDLVKDKIKDERNGVPFRIPLGSEAVYELRNKSRDTLDNVNKWASVALSADYGGLGNGVRFISSLRTDLNEIIDI